MTVAAIKAAIQGKTLLAFSYDGYSRTVEPHTYGVDTKGNPALRAYQVCGGSESEEYVGWKMFLIESMRQLSGTQQHFAGPRAKYKRNDCAFKSIYAQL